MYELGALKTGEKGVIAKINAPNPLKMRLISMGLIRGAQVEMLARSFFGATVMVRLKHAGSFSLRRDEARHILLSAKQRHRQYRDNNGGEVK